MQSLDPVVRDALDEMSPPRTAAREWEDLIATLDNVSSARPLDRRPRKLVWVIGAPVLAAAAILAVVLAWPAGGNERPTLLEQAAAAIGTGPVLHVTIQSGWGGAQVDLTTGAREQIHGGEELWFDPERGIKDVSRFAGVVQSAIVYPPGRVKHLDETLAFLATNYRNSLRSGRAHVLGKGKANGEAVYWVRVDAQTLPDTDGRDHVWAHDVAISQESFKPVATRETRDGALGPDGISLIQSIETLASGSGEFTSTTPQSSGPMSYERKGSLSLDEARTILGGVVLSAGEAVGNLPLSRITEDTRREGLNRSNGQWAKSHNGVTLFYGPATGGGIGTPPPEGDYLQISEATELDEQFQRGVRNYSPPEGTVLLFGGVIGVMQLGGIHVALAASDESLLLAGAKALHVAR